MLAGEWYVFLEAKFTEMPIDAWNDLQKGSVVINLSDHVRPQ